MTRGQSSGRGGGICERTSPSSEFAIFLQSKYFTIAESYPRVSPFQSLQTPPETTSRRVGRPQLHSARLDRTLCCAPRGRCALPGPIPRLQDCIMRRKFASRLCFEELESRVALS